MRHLFSFLIGKRFLMLFAGYSDKGTDSQIKIGVIRKIYNSSFLSVFFLIEFHGYDLCREDYLKDVYSSGYYSFKDLINIYLAQPFLLKQYSDVDLSKNPNDFYSNIN